MTKTEERTMAPFSKATGNHIFLLSAPKHSSLEK